MQMKSFTNVEESHDFFIEKAQTAEWFTVILNLKYIHANILLDQYD